MKRTFVIGIIFLFIGLSLSPSLTAITQTQSKENQLAEVTIELCGMSRSNNYGFAQKLPENTYFLCRRGFIP